MDAKQLKKDVGAEARGETRKVGRKKREAETVDDGACEVHDV